MRDRKMIVLQAREIGSFCYFNLAFVFFSGLGDI